MTQMNISMKQKPTHRERTCGGQVGMGWGGMECEFGISRDKLLYTGWINSKVLLNSTATIFNILG